MPFFTVVIPTYNRFEKTRRAIGSVLEQSFTDYELVVVDDGSTDDTADLQRLYGDRIRYIRQENRGVSAARNRGIAAGDSPYVAFLDSDDQWLPSKLEEQKIFIEENPRFRIHQCNEIWVRNGRRVNPRLKHQKREGDIFIDSLDLCLISPSAVVLDRALFEEYGLFDEELPACEDYDLWLRISAHEPAGLLNSNLMIRYGGHEDQLSQRFWGMDRFRLCSIINLLKKDGAYLSPAYAEAAVKSAGEKCMFLIKGAEKRNRLLFADNMKTILSQIKSEDYSSIDCRSLLER